ncbi:MAG: hypothetical protein Q8936_16605 [Bacillota bacterium]|nr:hypothetical protein [Bacillota bacterium]
MIEEAKKKIKDEMEKSKDNFTKDIGNYLLQQIEINTKAAEKIVTGDKTIQGAIEKMTKIAEKRVVRKGNMAVVRMTPEEGFEIVAKYYGFEGVQTEIKVEEVIAPIVKEVPVTEAPKKEKAKFEVNIEDLLG